MLDPDGVEWNGGKVILLKTESIYRSVLNRFSVYQIKTWTYWHFSSNFIHSPPSIYNQACWLWKKGSHIFMGTMATCSFHSVPHFQECSPGVTVNGDFNLGELLEKIPMWPGLNSHKGHSHSVMSNLLRRAWQWQTSKLWPHFFSDY